MREGSLGPDTESLELYIMLSVSPWKKKKWFIVDIIMNDAELKMR